MGRSLLLYKKRRLDYSAVTEEIVMVPDIFAILILLLAIINILISVPILYYVTRPKIIEITKSPEGVERRAVMSPSGAFIVEKKRDPVINDDEALVLRDENI